MLSTIHNLTTIGAVPGGFDNFLIFWVALAGGVKTILAMPGFWTHSAPSGYILWGSLNHTLFLNIQTPYSGEVHWYIKIIHISSDLSRQSIRSWWMTMNGTTKGKLNSQMYLEFDLFFIQQQSWHFCLVKKLNSKFHLFFPCDKIEIKISQRLRTYFWHIWRIYFLSN